MSSTSAPNERIPWLQPLEVNLDHLRDGSDVADSTAEGGAPQHARDPENDDALQSTTLALLLETLGADKHFGYDRLLALGARVGGLVYPTESSHDLGEWCVRVIRDAAIRAGQHLALVRTAQEVGCEPTAANIAAGLDWLALRDLGDYLEDFVRVPESAFAADLTEISAIASDLGPVLTACRETRMQWPANVRHSARDLDLDATIAGLRDKGFLFFHSRSDSARDQALKHFDRSARQASKSSLADQLAKVRSHLRAVDRLQDALRDKPDWYRWLVDHSAFTVRTRRRDALVWAIVQRDRRGMTEDAILLLADGRWQEILRRAIEARQPLSSANNSLPTSRTLARLKFGLDAVAPAVPHQLQRWTGWAAAERDTLGLIVSAVDAGKRDPHFQRQLDEIAAELRLEFPDVDSSRAEYSALQMQLRASVETAFPADRIGFERPIEQDELREVFRGLAGLERVVRQAVRIAEPVQGPLTVAIAGRTKSGKTTLRKALTRQADDEGIGHGAHRTTRAVTLFEFGRLRFIDTPGVAALDDDFDAERAWETCRGSDAVVWNYADTLRVEEAEYVRDLLTIGKPTLVAVNAKWRVDSRHRLAMFARSPDLAFRHLRGHEERIKQIADSVGAPMPLVLHVHSGAAHASLAQTDELAVTAMRASRLLEVEEQLTALLGRRSLPLRAMRLSDWLRAPIAELDAVMTDELATADTTLEALRRTADRQQRALLDAVARASRAAHTSLQTKRAVAESQLNALIEKLGGSEGDNAWVEFVERMDIPEVGRTLELEFRAELGRIGRTMAVDWNFEVRTAARKFQKTSRPGTRWMRRVLRAAWGAARNVALGFWGKRLALKATESVNPALLIAMVVADVASGAAQEISKDVNRSRAERHEWTTDTVETTRRELRQIVDAARLNLDASVQLMRAAVVDQYARQRADASTAQAISESFAELQREMRAVRNQCDLVLSRRLVQLAGGEPSCVLSARRTPGSTFTIWTEARHAAPLQRDLGALLEGFVQERLIVRTAAKARRLARNRQPTKDGPT